MIVIAKILRNSDKTSMCMLSKQYRLKLLVYSTKNVTCGIMHISIYYFTHKQYQKCDSTTSSYDQKLKMSTVSLTTLQAVIMQTKGFLLDKNRDVYLICINYSVFCTQGVSPISMGLPSLARACTENIKQRSMCPYIACNIHKDLDT